MSTNLAPSHGRVLSALLGWGLSALLLPNALAIDVDLVGLVKGARYFQTTTGAPALANPGYQFSAFVQADPANIASANLQLPNGSLQGLPMDFGDAPSLEDQLADVASLIAAYPNGTYTVKVATVHDGNQNFVVTFPQQGGFPTAPAFSDPAALLAVDPGAAATVRWASLGGTALDYARVQIINALDKGVFNTPEPGRPGALDGTTTSTDIPAGTLSPGEAYTVILTYARVVASGTGYAP